MQQKVNFVIVFVMITSFIQTCAGFIKDEEDVLRHLAKKWSPLVYLAQGEIYKPSTVSFFVANTKLHGGTSEEAASLHSSYVPKCKKDCYLESKKPMSSPNSILSFFHGEHPNDVSTYVLVKQVGTTMELFYWFFYPYNEGKSICIGYHAHNLCLCGKAWGHCLCPRINGCIGGYKSFGNHVGDWEHITVKLVDGKPYSIHLSAHSFGYDFVYDGQHFINSKGQQKLEFYGTHPIVYSAKGSHGCWSSSGNHIYKEIANGARLTDKCSKGLKWRTWNKLNVIKYKKNAEYTSPSAKFLMFLGRWGNRKRDCHIYEYISGECVLNNGPSGPQGKSNKKK